MKYILVTEGSLPSIDVVLPNTPSTIAQVEVAENTYQSRTKLA